MRDSTYIYIENILNELLESCKERRLSYEDQMYLLDFIYSKNSVLKSSRSLYGSLDSFSDLAPRDMSGEMTTSFLSTLMNFLEDRSDSM